jgi:hypothetical protein
LTSAIFLIIPMYVESRRSTIAGSTSGYVQFDENVSNKQPLVSTTKSTDFSIL